jgi:hypothetical protein
MYSNFDIVSDFGFRYSNFKSHLVYCGTEYSLKIDYKTIELMYEVYPCIFSCSTKR